MLDVNSVSPEGLLIAALIELDGECELTTLLHDAGASDSRKMVSVCRAWGKPRDTTSCVSLGYSGIIGLDWYPGVSDFPLPLPVTNSVLELPEGEPPMSLLSFSLRVFPPLIASFGTSGLIFDKSPFMGTLM